MLQNYRFEISLVYVCRCLSHFLLPRRARSVLDEIQTIVGGRADTLETGMSGSTHFLFTESTRRATPNAAVLQCNIHPGPICQIRKKYRYIDSSPTVYQSMVGSRYGRTKRCDIKKAIYFFEMSVLFETGELNAYVYDGGGLYRRKYV